MIIISYFGTIFRTFLFLLCLFFSVAGGLPNITNEALYKYYIIIPLAIVVVIDYVKYKDSTVRQSGAGFLLLSLVAHILMLLYYNNGGGFENFETNIYLFGFAGLLSLIEIFFCIIFFANVNDCKKKLNKNKK